MSRRRAAILVAACGAGAAAGHAILTLDVWFGSLALAVSMLVFLWPREQ